MLKPMLVSSDAPNVPKRVTVPISTKQEAVLNALSAEIGTLQGKISAILAVLCADIDGEKKNVVGIEHGQMLVDVS